MLPDSSQILLLDFENTKEKASLTYKISDDQILGMIDGKEAIKQAISLLLRTERFEHSIFSPNYGVEFAKQFSVNPELFEAKLKLRTEEALLCDDRIISMSNFSASITNGVATIGFTVETIYGETSIEEEF